jgi:SAM-dependent methyltransferase
MGPERGDPTQDLFWRRAGEVGYGEALFRSRRVEQHVVSRQWRVALETGGQIGLAPTATVLELGCGDGAFAAEVLGAHYAWVEAMDKSETAIERARARPQAGNVRFRSVDLIAYEYEQDTRWDGAFLMGILHHVKGAADRIVGRLSRVTPRVVVLEPSGDNPVRKALERLPSYRAAGEESFRHGELVDIFERHGYRQRSCRSINLFAPFTPDSFFPLIRTVERTVERLPALSGLCSTRVMGFVAEPRR